MRKKRDLLMSIQHLGVYSDPQGPTGILQSSAPKSKLLPGLSPAGALSITADGQCPAPSGCNGPRLLLYESHRHSEKVSDRSCLCGFWPYLRSLCGPGQRVFLGRGKMERHDMGKCRRERLFEPESMANGDGSIWEHSAQKLKRKSESFACRRDECKSRLSWFSNGNFVRTNINNHIWKETAPSSLCSG